MPKINTWGVAAEQVERSGDKYILPRAVPIETCGSVPTLVYDAEEETIWSVGGRKYDVDADPRLPVIEHDRWGYPWSFGEGTDAHERARIQRRRAYALIEYALSDD